MYQIGHSTDAHFWKGFTDPPRKIDALIADVPNTLGIMWVDFTVKQLYPN